MSRRPTDGHRGADPGFAGRSVMASSSCTDAGFSLVEGGPLFRLLRSARLVGVRHDVPRRALLLGLLGWLPPVVAALGSGAPPATLIALHARFLLTNPVLLWAEGFIDLRVRAAVASLGDGRLVGPD